MPYQHEVPKPVTASRRCPYCNSTAVVGLGAFIDTTPTMAEVMVEVCCRDCGKLFLSEDRRNAEQQRAGGPVQDS